MGDVDVVMGLDIGLAELSGVVESTQRQITAALAGIAPPDEHFRQRVAWTLARCLEDLGTATGTTCCFERLSGEHTQYQSRLACRGAGPIGIHSVIIEQTARWPDPDESREPSLRVLAIGFNAIHVMIEEVLAKLSTPRHA